ncbi:MAG: hypothetical protein MZV63_50290 [Marinilabiliales bacterium]|nr:hypothetical protein [Marinilabiliales bacterium]
MKWVKADPDAHRRNTATPSHSSRTQLKAGQRNTMFSNTSTRSSSSSTEMISFAGQMTCT